MKTVSPVIRGERPDDIDDIERVLRRTFEDHPHSQQTEHLIVARLRAAGMMLVRRAARIFSDEIFQWCGPAAGAVPVAEVSYNPAFSDLLMNSER